MARRRIFAEGAIERPGGLGIAVDLGTTELRATLVQLAGGQRLAVRAIVNPLAPFGSDVLARLEQAADAPEEAEIQRGLLVVALGGIISELCREHGLAPGGLDGLTVVGNTAMLALLVGQSSVALLRPGMWRKKIECRFVEPAAIAKALGLAQECRIEIVQPLAGFVGSDLLAGVLALELTREKGSLLLDFGANTEIALWDGARLWATSAAGGPAFEGCGISCGMSALPGAVQRVSAETDAPQPLTLEVVGGGEPRGICGTGLVDVAACLRRLELLTPAGRFSGRLKGARAFTLDVAGAVVVTGADLDALQRAKAGVAAAARCLLTKAGLPESELTRVCIAGSFGSDLDPVNAAAIGLLPPLVTGRKMELCGNTALAGCELFLARGGAEELAAALHPAVINMSYLAEYEESFVDNLLLRPWQ